MLTTFHAPRAVTAALDAGAAGFLLKDTGPHDLVQAVRAAARGEPVLAPRVLRDLVDQHVEHARRTPADNTAADATRSAARQRPDRLTATELRVLRVLAEGAANDEIARRLLLSTGAVKAHIGRILTKLECRNRVQAAVLAHDAGLDPDADSSVTA